MFVVSISANRMFLGKRDANYWEKGDHSGARFDVFLLTLTVCRTPVSATHTFLLTMYSLQALPEVKHTRYSSRFTRSPTAESPVLLYNLSRYVPAT